MKFNAKVEGDKVLMSFNDRTFIELHHEAALEMASIVRGLAKQAEEFANAESIIADAAILHRSGAPFGLTSNPKMQAEAKKAAQWDTNLRRYMPTPSMPSKEVFGTPTIKAS